MTDIRPRSPSGRLARFVRRFVAAVAIGTVAYLALGASLGFLNPAPAAPSYTPAGDSHVAGYAYRTGVFLQLAVVRPLQPADGWFGPAFYLLFTGTLVACIALAYAVLAIAFRGLGARDRLVLATIGVPFLGTIAGAVLHAVLRPWL